jgi:hypothetical protein
MSTVKTRSVADIKDLMQDTHESDGNLFHWAIEFSVKIPEEFSISIPDLTPEQRQELGIPENDDIENISPWATDEIVIQGGPDALESINWLIAYVNDPEQYGLPVAGFRLNAVNLLSEADVTL